MLAGAEERDRAVDPAAHRDGDPLRVRCGAEHLRERVRERVGRERLARHGRSLEQRQSRERPLEPGRVRGDDPVTVDRQPDERELLAASGVSDHLEHAVQRTGEGLHCPCSTLCVASRVNVNQHSRKGSPGPV